MGRILVIDDDEGVLQLIRRALRQGGHDVDCASNGEDGLRMFLANRPDVVVTDIFMPETDGLEFIRSLRDTGHAFHLIAMSGGGAAGHLDVLRVARQLGAQRVLTKPFRVAELVGLIRELIGWPADTETG